MKKPMLFVIALLALALPLVACGDEDENGSSDPATGVSDVERYCELSRQGDEAGEEHFEELEDDPNATQEDYEAAERTFVEENEELFDEIAEVAPEEISEEIVLLLEGVRIRAGLSDADISNKELGKAERTINAFEKKNCDDGGEAP